LGDVYAKTVYEWSAEGNACSQKTYKASDEGKIVTQINFNENNKTIEFHGTMIVPIIILFTFTMGNGNL